MDVMCSICQCTLSRQPPEGSTQVADLYESLKTPVVEQDYDFGFLQPGSGDGNNLNVDQPHIVTTPCGHLFHSSCLTQWFLMIGTRRCPLCNFVTPVHQMQRIYPTMQPLLTQPAITSTDPGQHPISPNRSPLTLSNITIPGRIFLDENEDNDEIAAVAETVNFLTQSAALTLATGTTAPVTYPSEWTLETDSDSFQTRVSAPQQSITQDLTNPPIAESETAAAIEVPLQVMETYINGIRTMIYHFISSANAPSVPDRVNQLLTTDVWRDRPSAREIIRRQQRSQPPPSLFHRSCQRCLNLSRIQALMASDLRDLNNLITEQKVTIQSLTESAERARSGEVEPEPTHVPNDDREDEEPLFRSKS